MTILKGILLTILYILFNELFSLWILIVSDNTFEYLIEYYQLLNSIFKCILILTLLIIIRKSTKFLIVKTKYYWYIIAFILGATFDFVQTVLNVPYNLIAGTEYNIIYNFDGLSELLNVNVLTTILFIPICEELYFREFIQTLLQKKLIPLYSIIISSLLFASIHLPYSYFLIDDYTPSFHHFYITFFGGLIAAWLYYKSKSILPPIIMHIMWNLFVIIL